MKEIKKVNDVGGSKHPQQVIDQTIDCISVSININMASGSSVNITAYPTAEQSFLHNLWSTFESLQDLIVDQDSEAYQLLEVINPILLDSWIQTRRR